MFCSWKWNGHHTNRFFNGLSHINKRRRNCQKHFPKKLTIYSANKWRMSFKVIVGLLSDFRGFFVGKLSATALTAQQSTAQTTVHWPPETDLSSFRSVTNWIYDCFSIAGSRYCACTHDDYIGTVSDEFNSIQSAKRRIQTSNICYSQRTCDWLQQTVHVSGHFDYDEETATEVWHVQFLESIIQRDLGELN